MGDANNFRDMHGCACGKPGVKVATRYPNGVYINTREREVDVFHKDGQLTHTNQIRLGEPMVLKQD